SPTYSFSPIPTPPATVRLPVVVLVEAVVAVTLRLPKSTVADAFPAVPFPIAIRLEDTLDSPALNPFVAFEFVAHPRTPPDGKRTISLPNTRPADELLVATPIRFVPSR